MKIKMEKLSRDETTEELGSLAKFSVQNQRLVYQTLAKKLHPCLHPPAINIFCTIFFSIAKLIIFLYWHKNETLLFEN